MVIKNILIYSRISPTKINCRTAYYYLGKKELVNQEISERSHNGLPEYNYIEDIPTDERKREPSNLIVNNASNVKFEKNPLESVDKKLEDPNINFVFNDGKDIWTKFYCSIYDSLIFELFPFFDLFFWFFSRSSKNCRERVDECASRGTRLEA